MSAAPCFLLLFVFFVSCHHQDKVVQTSEQDSTSANVDPPADLPTKNSFIAFWKEFRQAVLQDDTSRIVEMTQFPFDTRSELDDSFIEHGRDRFIQIYRIFLNQENRSDDPNNLYDTYEFDHIKHTVIPDTSDFSMHYASVGSLAFNRIDDKWKLVLFYLDNMNADSVERLEQSIPSVNNVSSSDPVMADTLAIARDSTGN